VALLNPDKVRVVTLGSQEFLDLETARRGKTRLQYTARAGDTLAKIAKRYGLAAGDLARVNRLSATSELGEGQRIVVYSPTPELPREITVSNSASGKRPIPTSKTVLAKNAPTHATPKPTAAHSQVKTMATTSGARPASALRDGQPTPPAPRASRAPSPAAKPGGKGDAKPATKSAAKPGPTSRPASAPSKPAASKR
jgi:murein DD-endopeptidase MepM/ murein hydrolase activator NlpD